MNPFKYIISKIDELSKNFPSVKFSYQLDEFSETHFIEVLPKEVFDEYESKFVKEQNKVILDFIKKFPNEGLAFISDDDFFSVDDPQYVKCGTDYQGLVPNLSWNHKALSELLIDYIPYIQTSFVLNQELHQVKQNAIKCTFSLKSSSGYKNFELLTNNLPLASTNTDIYVKEELTDDPNYCLAA